jgi:predicted nucleic acid-binding protein
MKLLLDTSVLVDHLRGHPAAVDLLLNANARGDELIGSVVSRAEVLGGMRSNERRATLALLDVPRWMDVTIEIADRAGQLARRYRSSHPGIDIADFLIVATCEVTGAQLATRNVKHFPMLPGLANPY